MSDIPDWLVELAAQQDEGGGEEQEGAESPELEDTFSQGTGPQTEVDASAETTLTLLEEESPSPPEEKDLVQELRSQVVVDDTLAVSEEAVVLSDHRGGVFIGLQPWQQFVLALLLFLDVAVIGLLVLVMLGRVAIP